LLLSLPRASNLSIHRTGWKAPVSDLHVRFNQEERKWFMALNLGEMTTEEKLRAMEMLWDDICRSAPDFSSPSWHEDVLRERERRIRDGKDKFVDWDQAKKDILDSTP
jgi:hypothetical protein